MKPYGVVADLHCHNWSQFSGTDKAGVNTRLVQILDELERTAQMVADRGGDRIFVAGDLFHVRGSIEPSVMNPVEARIRHIVAEYGVQIIVIPGNHDLEGKNATELGSALTTLNNIEGFYTACEPMYSEDVLLIPWMERLDDLRNTLAFHAAKPNHERLTVIIHAPVDGVIMGIPDHGLNPQELANFGFGRVLSGHYHDHKRFPGGVYSIGATTHQTWNDVGTLAGFLIVSEEGGVEHIRTQAPLFVDAEQTVDDSEFAGNYVRIKLSNATETEIKEARDRIMGAGALGVNLLATKALAATRTGSTVKAGASIEQSVSDYIASKTELAGVTGLGALCIGILSEANS